MPCNLEVATSQYCEITRSAGVKGWWYERVQLESRADCGRESGNGELQDAGSGRDMRARAQAG